MIKRKRRKARRDTTQPYYYGYVDSFPHIVLRKSKCFVCGIDLLKGTNVIKSSYCGSFLIQKKYSCITCELPNELTMKKK